MFKKIFLLLAAGLLIIGGIATLHGLGGQHNVVITFAKAKHLMVDDHVYLSGALAGKVRAVETKVRQVVVTIDLKKTFYDQLSSTSTFFIDDDTRHQKRKCVLIKLARRPGSPITPGTQLTGIDSAFEWSAHKVGDHMTRMVSEPLEKDSDDLANVWQDIRQAFEGIDLKEMEEELRKKTDSLRRNLNKAWDSEGLKQTMAEIEEKLEELKETLKEADDSKAAQKLKKTLEDLFKQLGKKAPERIDAPI